MNKEILRLAIPNIISNISVPLISTVDTILMGHLSSVHLGAIGLGSMIFNFLYWNFGFLRMGTTGMTAQAYGADNKKLIANTFYRACAVAIVIALLIMLSSVLLAKVSMAAMQIQPTQVDMVNTYFFTRIWEAPATLLLYALMGWFFGMQDAVRPLIITVTVNLANIVLSIYFVKYLGWEVRGVALGTVIAQYLAVVLAIGFILYKYRSYLILSINEVFQQSELFRFFNINKDIFLRTICLSTAFFFFYSQSSKGGELILAINVILLQFLNWMSYGVDGFAYASESLVGRYHGASNPEKTHKAIKYSFYWGGAFAMMYSIVYALGYDTIITLFNDEARILEASGQYYIWTVLLPLIAFSCYIWDGIYIGLTASKTMRNSMFIALILYIGIYYALVDVWPTHAIWIALLVFLAGRGLLLTWYFRKYELELV